MFECTRLDNKKKCLCAKYEPQAIEGCVHVLHLVVIYGGSAAYTSGHQNIETESIITTTLITDGKISIDTKIDID